MRTPEFMPILSRGAHRSPRKGGCFMEYASYLAGERWSDRPGCTHPVLAALAREVNDRVDDDHRQELVPLIPLVIGVNTADPRAGAWVAREASLAALSCASPSRQGVSALGAVECERVLNELEGRPAPWLSPRTAEVLAGTPWAHEWAREFAAKLDFCPTSRFSDAVAARIAAIAVATIAESPRGGPQRLVELVGEVTTGLRGWLSATCPDATVAPGTPAGARVV